MRKFYIIIFIFLFIITNKVNAIESSNYIALGFADNLYEQGDYYRAVTEYHRYLCFYPYGASRGYVLYKLGLCYRENGEYNTSQSYLCKSVKWEEDSDIASEAHLILARNEIRENYFSRAEYYITQYNLMRSDKGEGYYWLGWNFIYNGEWQEASSNFIKASELDLSSELSSASSELSINILSALELPYRSPKLAKLFSTFIPGTGQIYAGKYLQGAIGLALNGALAYLFFYSLSESDLAEASVIYTLVWARYYWGNRKLAREYAEDFNREHTMRFIHNLEDEYPSP